MDFAPPQPAELRLSSAGDKGAAQSVPALTPEARILGLCGVVIEDFWHAACAAEFAIEPSEFASALLAIGAKYNYGFPPGVDAASHQIAAFWQGLQLRELALAQACALGRDIAWQRFLAEYREPLTQAAIGITGSATAGRELADSLYSEMFGLRERNGARQSPLASYSGRGSLKGFLRATLAQRNIDRHRRTQRETPLDREDFVAPAPAAAPQPDLLARLGASLAATLGALDAEERFLLSSYFLDRRTLLDISRLLRVHEATVGRRIQRLTTQLRKDLLKDLQAHGLSRAAAEETLATDPRFLDLNLRSLLQASRSDAFPSVEGGK